MAVGGDILAKNLAALRRRDAALAERVAAAAPLPLQWTEARTGVLTATRDYAGRAVALASRYDPLAEADKLVGHVDHAKSAAVVVLGFGLGYHPAQLAGKMTDGELLVVYEPDVALLRAVLERVDHSAWLGRDFVLFADDAVDRAALTKRIEPNSATMTQGTVLIEHPPTRSVAGDKLAAFGKMIAEVVAYCRTNVATALVNAGRTIGNLAHNAHHYAAGATTDALHNLMMGLPAVCVGAGPSLVKNVHLLADPAVRRNVVVIAVQTTLKPLLDRGIEPDFVTALDYSEICRRFYEGLPPLPNVTLVAEPKCHPAILESFPGPIRICKNDFLDQLVGPLKRPRVAIATGATVAHLSYYLARHLGCDPVLFIGQDLGFSDGVYYAPGTAIHDVWAPELSPFNTVEMMEWQRVARHRRQLQRLTDVHGRPIYSDEQMLTYLKQFERDFAQATETVIDCTEGGVPKEHTQRMTLAEALQKYATRPTPPVPLPAAELDAARVARLLAILRDRIDEVEEIRRLTQKTVPILEDMIENQTSPGTMAELFKKLRRNQQRVEELKDAFALVSQLNTIGAFHRNRLDREIHHQGQDAADRQKRQLRRDITNLDWTTQACDEALSIFRAALRHIERDTAVLAAAAAAA